MADGTLHAPSPAGQASPSIERNANQGGQQRQAADPIVLRGRSEAVVGGSFDRAVTVGGFPTFQMKAGSLETPGQFVAVDESTFRINFLRRDRLTLPDLAVPVPVIINSELAFLR